MSAFVEFLACLHVYPIHQRHINLQMALLLFIGKTRLKTLQSYAAGKGCLRTFEPYAQGFLSTIMGKKEFLNLDKIWQN